MDFPGSPAAASDDDVSHTIKYVPVVKDTMSFDSRQEMRIREMENRLRDEIKWKEHELEMSAEQMRREDFLQLYPSETADEENNSSPADDHRIVKRYTSNEVLGIRKMRTMFFEYSSIEEKRETFFEKEEEEVEHNDPTIPVPAQDSGGSSEGEFRDRRYQLKFDVSIYEQQSIAVTTDGSEIEVKAIQIEEDERGIAMEREVGRRIQKPKEIDQRKLKAYLTTDGILLVEAAAPRHSSGGRTTLSHSASRSSHGSHTSKSSSQGSPSAGAGAASSSAPDTPSKEKIGVPVFRDENGTRRMHLTVELGSAFEPDDVTVQVIKENRIHVHAKRREKTTERFSKNKFNKEYELGEKIETLTLRGGLTKEGKLLIGAVAKGHAVADDGLSG